MDQAKSVASSQSLQNKFCLLSASWYLSQYWFFINFANRRSYLEWYKGWSYYKFLQHYLMHSKWIYGHNWGQRFEDLLIFIEDFSAFDNSMDCPLACQLLDTHLSTMRAQVIFYMALPMSTDKGSFDSSSPIKDFKEFYDNNSMQKNPWQVTHDIFVVSDVMQLSADQGLAYTMIRMMPWHGT